MKKKIWKRCLFGAPVGLLIFMGIFLAQAHLRGDGEIHVGYYLIRVYGTEVNAMTAACISAMMIGMIWSGASVLYETDWNLLMQTAVHALLCVLPSMAVAWVMYWIPRNRDGIAQYAMLFGVIYVLVWLIQFLDRRKRVQQMNALLKMKEYE